MEPVVVAMNGCSEVILQDLQWLIASCMALVSEDLIGSGKQASSKKPF